MSFVLMNEFLLLKKEHFTKEFDVHETKLLKALERNKLTPENMNSFIVETDNKTITLFDQYQKEALFNLFVPSIDALENKTEVLVQETRRWDDTKGISYAMRTKEESKELIKKHKANRKI